MSKKEVTTVSYTCNLCGTEDIEPVTEVTYLHNYVGISGDGRNAVQFKVIPQIFYVGDPHLCKTCTRDAMRRAADDLTKELEKERIYAEAEGQ